MPLKEYFIHHRRTFAFLAFLVFAVYFNSLGNDFVSDDIGAIRDNPMLNEVSYLTYFRFNLRAMIYFLTNKIFGLNPIFYHLPNILFHLGSTWIIFLLVGLFFRFPIPLFAASLFATHPILTEGVTWISGGAYSNSTFFILLSLFSYILFNRGGSFKFYLVSLFFFLIALLFSEKVFIFPLFLFLYHLYQGDLGRHWLRTFSFTIIAFIWLFYLLGLLGSRAATLETSFYQKPQMENPFFQIPIAITSYLELIFWPKDLTLYHSEMSFTYLEYLARLTIFLVFLGIILICFKKGRPIFFWLVFFFIPLLPTLTPLGISWIVAERYAYLASLGIFVVIALIIQKIGEIFKNQKISYLLLFFIILILSLRTIIRNMDWQNQDTLWLAAAKTSPSSPQNHNNLGDYYGRHGNLEKAVEEFKKAIELLPNYGDAYHNLANTYAQMGQIGLAIGNYQNALKFNPNLWQSYQNLAAIYFSQEKFDLVIENLDKAIKVNPKNSNLYTNLGIVYLKLGEKEKAEATFRQALNLNPGDQRAKAGLLEVIKMK